MSCLHHSSSMKYVVTALCLLQFAAINLLAADVPPELVEAALERRKEIPLGGDFRPDPKSPVFVAVGHGGRIVLSRDDGKTWNEVYTFKPETEHVHGANNNQVWRDTVFRWPPILQFRALPMSYTHSGTALTNQDCHVEINGWPLKNPERAALCGRLFVRSSYNGRLLWKDFIPENVEANTPLYVIADGKLYLASGTRAEFDVRDLFTGERLPALTLGSEDRRVKWLTVEAGTLSALVGSPAEIRRPFAFALQPPVFAKHEKEHTLFGTEIVAWDLGEEKARWRHEEANLIDFTTMALNDGRLYFYSETKRLVCLDAGDGYLLWENSDRSWMDAVRRPQKVHNHNIRHMSTVTAGIMPSAPPVTTMPPSIISAIYPTPAPVLA